MIQVHFSPVFPPPVCYMTGFLQALTWIRLVKSPPGQNLCYMQFQVMCMHDQPVVCQAWWEQHPALSISAEICPPHPVPASSSLFHLEDAMFSSLHGIVTCVIIL